MCVCVCTLTERQNHARDLMKDYDFSKIDGIAIASGDGLLYEVLCCEFIKNISLHENIVPNSF